MVVCRDFAAAYLQVHFPNTHGGLTPAALVDVRLCIAKIAFFRRTVVATAPGAGSVSPRGIYSVCELETGKITALLLQTRFATHSGLTEGTVVRACGSCRAVLGICSTPSVLPSHGGLTPAALVSVRFCIAKIVIVSGGRSLQQHQERGASAPRGLANALTSAFPAHYRRRSPDDTHGGLTEGTVVRAYGCSRAMIHFCGTLSVLPSHGGLTCAALDGPSAIRSLFSTRWQFAAGHIRSPLADRWSRSSVPRSPAAVQCLLHAVS